MIKSKATKTGDIIIAVICFIVMFAYAVVFRKAPRPQN